MQVVIEFYRIRLLDDAHAVLGRVTCDAIDRKAAISMAGQLLHTLDMPQMPDAVRVCDDRGNQFHCSIVLGRTEAQSRHQLHEKGQQCFVSEDVC